MSGNLGDRPLPRPSRSGRYLAAIAVGSALSIPVGEVLPLARIASRRIIGTRHVCGQGLVSPADL
jgi:hypothetical protein